MSRFFFNCFETCRLSRRFDSPTDGEGRQSDSSPAANFLVAVGAHGAAGRWVAMEVDAEACVGCGRELRFAGCRAANTHGMSSRRRKRGRVAGGRRQGRRRGTNDTIERRACVQCMLPRPWFKNKTKRRVVLHLGIPGTVPGGYPDPARGGFCQGAWFA